MKVKHLETDNIFEIFTAKQGGEERMTCPVCSEHRRKKRIKCFSWNHDKLTGHCSHCQATFVKAEAGNKYISRENREYERPKWNNNTELSDNMVKYFERRGISQFVLRQMKVTEGIEWMPQVSKKVNTVQFNYLRNGELINTKYRDGAKNFKLAANAELIMYNYDYCIEKDQIIITEGEVDALSLAECGIWNVTSTPNGAGIGSLSMEYIDNSIELFESKKEIVIATDNDAPGINLSQQLAHRLGIEKCFKVDFSPHKDANEYLINEGKESLKNLLNEGKKPFPIEGVFSANDFKDELDLLYEKGLQPGYGINIPEFDSHITFETGRLYTWTGIPGCGKSELVDFILERLNIVHGWKTAYFSPENHPLQLHASKLIEKLTGEHFSKKTMPPEVYENAREYMKDNFFFISPKEDFKVETILDKARIAVFKYGVKNIVIDPYNKLEHQFTGSETQYISKFLDMITMFAKRNDVCFHLVAHPRKMNKDAAGNFEIPNLYDINGSSNFYNKTDFGITVYRMPQSSISDIHIQKVKFKHLGEPGKVQFAWNKNNGRYALFQGDVNSIHHDNNNHITGKIKVEQKQTNTFEMDGFEEPREDGYIPF